MKSMKWSEDGYLEENMICPDDGTCHHECEFYCWRVRYCEPLSGVFPGDQWPDTVRFDYTPTVYQKEL